MKLRNATVVLGLVGLVSCSGPRDSGPLPSPEEVPDPRLDALSNDAQSELSEKRQAVVELLDSAPRPGDEAVAEAFGALGRSFHARELLDAALSCYDVARRLEPQKLDWHYYPALIHLFRGQHDEAAALFEEAVRIDTDYLPARVLLAESAIARGQADTARLQLEEVLRKDPRSARAHFDLGRLAAAEEDHAAAVEHFEAALAIEPQASAIHYPLAIAYQRLGEEEKAAAELEQAGRNPVSLPDPRRKALAEESADSRSDLARGSRALVDGRPQEAVSWFRKAVEKDPSSSTAHLVLGSALARIGNDDEALRQLYQAAELDPSNGSAHHEIATLLAAGDEPATAIEHFERALELDPENVDARLQLAQLLESLGRLEEALDRYQQLIEIDPQNEPALVGWALGLANLGQKERAAREMKRLVAEHPSSLPLRVNLGAVLFDLGDVDGGLEEWRIAASMEGPPHMRALAHSNLGFVLSERGEYGLAIDHHRAALELDPDLLSSRVWLADLLRDRGDWSGAAHHYRVARRIDPSLVKVWVQEARSLARAGNQRGAKGTLEEGLRTVGSDPTLAHELALLLATSPDPSLRDGRRALELALAAFRSDKSADIARTIAMAFAESAHFEEAVSWQTRVLEEARARGDRAEIARMQAALDAYRRREPPYRLLAYPPY